MTIRIVIFVAVVWAALMLPLTVARGEPTQDQAACMADPARRERVVFAIMRGPIVPRYSQGAQIGQGVYEGPIEFAEALLRFICGVREGVAAVPEGTGARSVDSGKAQ